MISFLRVLSMLVVPLAPFLLLLSDDANFKGSAESSLVFVKPGTMGVHLAGAALLLLLGFRRANVVWVVLLFVGLAAAASQNRGGMLAAIAMITFAAVASGKLRQFAVFLAIAIGLIAIAYVADLSIPTNRLRAISARQVVENFLTILADPADKLDRTQFWRVNWSETIIDSPFHAPYFRAGNGFHVSLAMADAFVVGLDGN